MSPRVLTDLEVVRSLVGHEMGASDWLVLTPERVAAFVRATGDQQETAGDVLVPTFLTVSLLAGFAEEIFSFRIGAATLNYGLDRVRFPRPLSTGATVRARVWLRGLEAHASGHLVRLQYVVEEESAVGRGAQDACCVADALLLLAA